MDERFSLKFLKVPQSSSVRNQRLFREFRVFSVCFGELQPDFMAEECVNVKSVTELDVDDCWILCVF